MQRLPLADRHFPALLEGEKLQTIRWNEGPVTTGPLIFYLETDERLEVSVEVTRCSRMPLEAVGTFLGKEDEAGWSGLSMLEGMRRHYPDIAAGDLVDVIEYRVPHLE